MDGVPIPQKLQSNLNLSVCRTLEKEEKEGDHNFSLTLANLVLL